MLQSIPSITSQTPLDPLLDSYLTYYAGGNSHTSKAKRNDTRNFLEFLAGHKKITSIDKLIVSHWDHTATQRYVEESLKRGFSPATVSRRLATLKHIGRTLADRIPGFINPAREVRPPIQKSLQPKTISPKEIRNIREKARENLSNKNNFKLCRDQMLLDFLLDTGLRADEVRTLKLSQVSKKLDWVEGVRTKGKKYRNVYITSKIRKKLTEYIALREIELAKFITTLTAKKSREFPLFISTFKADFKHPETFAISPKSLWRIINNFAVDTELHPHLLRHTYAVDLLKSTNDIRLVAQALGHSDVKVTMKYTERSDLEVAKALEKSRRAVKS